MRTPPFLFSFPYFRGVRASPIITFFHARALIASELCNFSSPRPQSPRHDPKLLTNFLTTRSVVVVFFQFVIFGGFLWKELAKIAYRRFLAYSFIRTQPRMLPHSLLYYRERPVVGKSGSAVATSAKTLGSFNCPGRRPAALQPTLRHAGHHRPCLYRNLSQNSRLLTIEARRLRRF